MANKQLPSKLGKEPLVDAVFELRCVSSVSIADILPGILHSALGAGLKIERLPVADLPMAIRQFDPQLLNAPVVRVFWDNYIFLLGDNMVGVACVMPYPGWKSFRNIILKVVDIINQTGIVTQVARYSMKYVDILETSHVPVSELINMKLVVGDIALKDQNFQLNMQIKSDPFIQALQVGSPAQSQSFDGKIRKGTLVSIDTLSSGELPDLKVLAEELPSRLDALHDENKKMFFACLTSAAINYLEPSFD
ncbi:MAG: TIGR04255 family protein [Vitreoscilla sp.]|nr:TIGR04255 family protein [Polaromonas sp.]